MKNLFSWWKTGEDKPLLSDESKIKKMYDNKRNSVLRSVVLGYGFFYIVRLTLSVAKKPMVDAGILDVTQLGIMGSVMFYVYAVGKFTNGFLSNRANIKRFISTGLFVASIVNLILGFNSYFIFFVILWGINGWFQSMGSAPCVVSVTQWYSQKEYGSYYGIWAASHNIGEGLTFIATSTIVALWGWRMGFTLPGLICVGVAIILYITLQDRPQTYGLPHVSDYMKDYSAGKPSKKSIGQLELEVLRNPVIWRIGLASALLYTARYGIHSWGPSYFQWEKGFSINGTGWLMGLNTMFGLAGAVSSGFVSDKIFGSRRNIPTLIYGSILILGLVIIFISPAKHFWSNALGLGLFEFALGGSLVFLAGLIGVDVVPKKAAGAVKGVVGLISYLGVATSEWIGGLLIDAGKTVVDGKETYNCDYAFFYWIGAAILSQIVALSFWNVKSKA